MNRIKDHCKPCRIENGDSIESRGQSFTDIDCLPPRKDIGIQFLERQCKEGSVTLLKRIGFTLLYECNGNCTYCFIKSDIASGKANVRDEIHKEEFEEILCQAIPLGLEEIQLSGGEPMLKTDILEFVKIAKSYGVRVGIFTNGVFLDKEMLIALKLLNLNWIRVGLGGSDGNMSQRAGRLNDTLERFERIVSNIKTSVKTGIVTGVFCPVTKNNYNDIKKTADLARYLGVSYIVFCNYIPLGNEQDEVNRMSIKEHYYAIEEFLEAKEEQKGTLEVYAYYGFFEYLSPNWKESDFVVKGPCGRERLAFIANGDVRTCLCSTCKLDNFRSLGFDLEELWQQHPLLIKIRKNEKFQPCLSCRRRSVCQPCLTPELNLNKRINLPSPQCPAVREYNSLKKNMKDIDAAQQALRHNYEQCHLCGNI